MFSLSRRILKGKEKRISFEAESERRMRRRRKFSSNPSWVRVYEIKLLEHLGFHKSNKNKEKGKKQNLVAFV